MAAAILLASPAATAAEIKVISSVGMRAVLEALQPQFERTTQHKLILTFGTAVPLKRQIDEGAAFDVTILTPPMLEDLAKSGKVQAGSVGNVAKTGIGLAARKDAVPPRLVAGEPAGWRVLYVPSGSHTPFSLGEKGRG
jgi:molybdate transport system substrate-binding protein